MQARASSPAVVALTAAMGAGGVAGAGLGRKRKREAADIVEVSLESRYLSELGDSRFKLVPLLGHGKSHHFSSQVRCWSVNVRLYTVLCVSVSVSLCVFGGGALGR